MNDPIALRIFENALRSSGHFIAIREPIEGGTRYEILPAQRDDSERRNYSLIVVIDSEREDDEAAGWQFAADAVRYMR